MSPTYEQHLKLTTDRTGSKGRVIFFKKKNHTDRCILQIFKEATDNYYYYCNGDDEKSASQDKQW